MTHPARLWLPFLLCVAACSSGPPLRTYVLTPPIDPKAAIAPLPAGVPPPAKRSVEVRRILVPDFLDSTDILMRSGSNEVKASSTGRWGERLSLGLTLAISADLAARMPDYSIVQDGAGNASRQLRITINSLDLWESGRCVLTADWSIVDKDKSIPVTSGSGTFNILDLGGTKTVADQSLVDAVAGTLSKLADSIVPDVRARPGRTDLSGG